MSKKRNLEICKERKFYYFTIYFFQRAKLQTFKAKKIRMGWVK